MTLIKYRQPGTDLFGKRFSDIMDEFFNDAVTSRNEFFAPNIDISETDKQYLIDVEVPGLDKKDIELNVERNTLTVSGERRFENKEEGKTFHRVESSYGRFSRSFTLPENVDTETISANYNNGILSITVDKSEQMMKKQIKIK
ncbi:MAG: Hsp20/alpha crystallin family protein [Balneolaceae bacterium]|nr:MAG: Hsp20/alpha crystallin family protein [Balneolaceae bacterium]